MWRALMDWLPDLRVGTFEIRDLVSLVVGGLGAFLAYLAIKLGKDQAAISKRQAEIAETQHRILQEQLARRAVADVSITQGIPIRDGRVLARVYVENKGSKSISEYNWEFIVPEEYRDYLTIALPPGAIEELELQAVAGQVCKIYRGHRKEPVYPNIMSELLTITWAGLRPEWGNLVFWWKVFCEDGSFPNPKDFGCLNIKLYP
jgi:hypothetical protein